MIRSDGCHTRVLEMLHFLSSAGFDLTFYSFRDYPVWPWSDRHIAEFKSTFSKVELVLDRWTRGANFVRRSKNTLCSYFPQVSNIITKWTLPGLTPEWSRVKKKYPHAIYFVNYADGLTQLNGVDIDRAIVDTHDLTFRSYGLESGHSVWRSDVVRRFRKEFSLLSTTSLVIAIAFNESVLFELMLTGPKVCYVPPRMKPRGNFGEDVIAADILFLGAANAKNIRGINSFLSEFRNWRTYPRLVIAGNVCGHIDRELAHSAGVDVRGYVEDLSALYRSVRAVICPVEGTGVNIKVLEALSFGKPVFACESAISGLPPGSESCVFQLSEQSVGSLLANSAQLARASKAAIDYVDGPFIRQCWSHFHNQLRYLTTNY
jgi:hypothetical protein